MAKDQVCVASREGRKKFELCPAGKTEMSVVILVLVVLLVLAFCLLCLFAGQNIRRGLPCTADDRDYPSCRASSVKTVTFSLFEMHQSTAQICKGFGIESSTYEELLFSQNIWIFMIEFYRLLLFDWTT